MDDKKKLFRLEIARTGTFGAGGNPITLQDLRDVIETFDGKAPISLGHYMAKQDWWPAWGNVENLSLSEDPNGTDGVLVADISVQEVLADAIRNGFYPGWSVSIPARAADGKRYLHHLAFLGSVPPAIRDLRIIATADGVAPDNSIRVEGAEGFQYSDQAFFDRTDFSDGIHEIDTDGHVIDDLEGKSGSPDFSDTGNEAAKKLRKLYKASVRKQLDAALEGRIPAGMKGRVHEFADMACESFDFSDEAEMPPIISLFLELSEAMGRERPRTGRTDFSDIGGDSDSIDRNRLARMF